MKNLRPLAFGCGLVLILLAPTSACAQAEPPRAPLSTFDYDATAPLDVRIVEKTDHGTYTVTDMTYASPAGGRVPALLYEPTGAGSYAGLLLMHGMPGSRKNAARFAEQYVQAGGSARFQVQSSRFKVPGFSKHELGA